MTTYEIGKWTLEQWQPREWRAWVPVTEGRIQEGDKILNELCGDWEGSYYARGLRIDTLRGEVRVRRPVPLPSLDPELVDACHYSDESEDGRECTWWKHPTADFPRYTHERSTVLKWLRALLPGYEQALYDRTFPKEFAQAVTDIYTASDKPAKTDEWRLIDKDTPKDKPILLAQGPDVGEGFWHDGSECYGHRGGAGWFWMDDACNLLLASNAHPTHWMPLPKGPEETDKDWVEPGDWYGYPGSGIELMGPAERFQSVRWKTQPGGLRVYRRIPDPVPGLRQQLERAMDLVRYCRAELHDANLIDDREYVELCGMDKEAVARLETYDSMRKRIEELKEELKKPCIHKRAKEFAENTTSDY